MLRTESIHSGQLSAIIQYPFQEIGFEQAFKNPLDFVKKGIYNYGQNDLLGESS